MLFCNLTSWKIQQQPIVGVFVLGVVDVVAAAAAAAHEAEYDDGSEREIDAKCHQEFVVIFA